MIRLVLYATVIISATLIGNSFSMKLTQRKENLYSIIESLEKMKSYIVFSGAEIRQVVLECFSGVKGFEIFAQEDCREDFTQWWAESIKSIYRTTALNRQDYELMMRFGKTLGVTDTEGQLKNCDLYIKLFSECYERVADLEDKNKRLYRVLGISLGCLVTLVLL